MFRIGLKKEGQEFIIMCKKSASFFKVYVGNGVDVVVLVLFKYLYKYIYIQERKSVIITSKYLNSNWICEIV